MENKLQKIVLAGMLLGMCGSGCPVFGTTAVNPARAAAPAPAPSGSSKASSAGPTWSSRVVSAGRTVGASVGLVSRSLTPEEKGYIKAIHTAIEGAFTEEGRQEYKTQSTISNYERNFDQEKLEKCVVLISKTFKGIKFPIDQGEEGRNLSTPRDEIVEREKEILREAALGDKLFRTFIKLLASHAPGSTEKRTICYKLAGAKDLSEYPSGVRPHEEYKKEPFRSFVALVLNCR